MKQLWMDWQTFAEEGAMPVRRRARWKAGRRLPTPGSRTISRS